MSLRAAWAALFGKTPDPMALERIEHCPDCDGREFSVGGQTFRVGTNGVRARLEVSGAVLSCLQCGRRWYATPEGLRPPHRDAMPPGWAMRDMQRDAAERTVRRDTGDPPKPRSERRPQMAEVHRQPPRG